MLHRLERRQIIPVGIDAAWAYFSTPRNLQEMTPPSLSFHILWGADEPMHVGQMIAYRVGVAPGVRLTWLTEITQVEPGVAFVDEQRRGPYALWHHLHRFTPVPGGTECLDRVTYQMPFGPLGAVVHALWVRRQLEGIFAFREQHLRQRFGSPAA